MYWIPSSAMVQQTRSSSLVKFTNNGHYKHINTCMWQNQDCVNCSVLRSVLRSILHSVLPYFTLCFAPYYSLVQHLRFMIQYCYSASTLRLALYYTRTTTTVWERFIDAYCMLKVYTWSRSSMQQQPKTAQQQRLRCTLRLPPLLNQQPQDNGSVVGQKQRYQAWQTRNH